MPYTFTGDGNGGSGGTNDHRLLAGRSDVNQHPATAVAVSPIDSLDATTVQSALAALAARSGVEVIAPTTAIALGAFKAAAFRPDGRVEPADHGNPAHLSRLAGVTLASATAGTTARVAVSGLVRFDGWQWTPGAPVYAGKGGELTQTPPTTGFIQSIGLAVDGEVLLVHIGHSIRRT